MEDGEVISEASDDEQLAKLAKTHGVELTSYRALRRYLAYLRLTSQLRSYALSQELDALEEAVEQAHLTSDEQRTLATLLKHLAILDELLHAKLTPERYAYFVEHRGEFTAEVMRQALSRVVSDQWSVTSDRGSITN